MTHTNGTNKMANTALCKKNILRHRKRKSFWERIKFIDAVLDLD